MPTWEINSFEQKLAIIESCFWNLNEKIKKNKYIFSAKVQNFNLNSSGVSHGGYLCAILDSGMGSAAHDVIEKNKRCVTISLDVKFIGISKYKDILTGNVLIIKKTRSLVFVKADLLKSKKH